MDNAGIDLVKEAEEFVRLCDASEEMRLINDGGVSVRSQKYADMQKRITELANKGIGHWPVRPAAPNYRALLDMTERMHDMTVNDPIINHMEISFEQMGDSLSKAVRALQAAELQTTESAA